MTKLLSIPLVPLLLTGLGCNRSPQSYLERGNHFLAAGKYDDAVLNYQKAIQKDPKFGEAYFQLGLASLQKDRLRPAYLALSNAVEFLPDREDIKIKLAEVCLTGYLSDSKKPKRLYDQIQLLSSQLLRRNPNSVEGLRFKGYLAMIDRRLSEAIEIFRKATAIKPLQPDVILPLTQALMDDKQFQESERVALDLIRNNKSFGPIYTVLYRQYAGTNRMADAEQILRAKVENNPREAAYVFELARHYAAVKDRDAVSRTLQRLLDNTDHFPQAHLQVGDFYMSIGNPYEAQRVFEEGIKIHPKESVYQKRLSGALVAQLKMDQAAATVDSVVKNDPEDEEGARLRALLLLEGGNAEKTERALAELQKLLEKHPGNPTLFLDLGRAHLAKGDLDAAQRDFEEATRRNAHPILARLLLAEITLAKRRPEEALRHTEAVLASQPGNARARFLHATSLIGMKSYNRARSELDGLLKTEPRYVDAQLQLGFLNLAEKRFKEAEASFSRIHRSSAGETRALQGLVEVRLAQGQSEDALRLLREELQTAPNSTGVRRLLAMTASRSGKYDIAIEQYQRLLTTDRNTRELQNRLAEVQRQSGDLKGAISTMERAIQLEPKYAGAHLFLADMQEEAGNPEKAIAEYAKVLELEPENSTALNNQAFLLIENGGSLEQALDLAQRAVRKSPGQPSISDTLGMAYLKKNLNESALQIFRNLVKAYPDNPTFHLHVAMALLKMGDKPRARTELETALTKKPDKNRDHIRKLLARLG